MKSPLAKLALSAAFGLALALALQSCATATPLEIAAEARGKYLTKNGSPVTQPPAEDEVVLATYNGSYSISKNVKGKLSFLDNAAQIMGIAMYGTTVPTIYHLTYPFNSHEATHRLLYRYIREFPNTSIEEVEYLDVRSVEQIGSPEYSTQTHSSSYTDKKGKRHEENNFDAITTYSFKGVVVRLPKAEPQVQVQEQYQYPPQQEQYQYPPPQEQQGQQYYYPPPPPQGQQYYYPPPPPQGQQYYYPPPPPQGQQYYYPPPQ